MGDKPRSLLHALVGGLAGALAVTAVHETLRRFESRAPRMDILGMRALRKLMPLVGMRPPNRPRLHTAALVGDIISNTAYYSLTGSGRSAWWRGPALGLAAGIGSVVLPPRLGLGSAPSRRTPTTRAMAVGYYLLGGIVSSVAIRLMAKQP